MNPDEHHFMGEDLYVFLFREANPFVGRSGWRGDLQSELVQGRGPFLPDLSWKNHPKKTTPTGSPDLGRGEAFPKTFFMLFCFPKRVM